MTNDIEEKTVILAKIERHLEGLSLNGIFKIDSRIGEGGMSEIYKGHNIQTDEDVAIKVILPELAQDQQMVSLFRREALILNRLNHEAIVRYHVFSHDSSADLLYMAMEFVDGPTLHKLMKKRSLTQLEACNLIYRIASGMATAHSDGIIHRDLSMDNIILVKGDVSQAKVIDFGIARANETNEATIIQSGFAGKYNFVSPEQVGLFGAQIGPASDIYSLGLTFAASLLGKPLNMTGSHADVVMKRQSVPNLSSMNPGVKPIIERMLQPNPHHRFSQMNDVVEAIKPLIGESAYQKEKKHTVKKKNRDTVPSSQQERHQPKRSYLLPLATILMLLCLSCWLIFTQTEKGQEIYQTAYHFLKSISIEVDNKTLTDKEAKSTYKVESEGTLSSIQKPPRPLEEKRPTQETLTRNLSQNKNFYEAASVEKAQKSTKTKEILDLVQESANETLNKTIAVTSKKNQRTAALQPENPIPETAITPVEWVHKFNAGHCFYASGEQTAKQSIQIEGFGLNVFPFQDMEQRFKSAFNFEPSIGVRLITHSQCPIINFVQDNKQVLESQHFTLKNDRLKLRESLVGNLTGILGKSVNLFVATPDGIMVNVTSLAKRIDDEVTITIPHNAFASQAGDTYLLFATISDLSLKSLRTARETNLNKFFETISQEIIQRNIKLITSIKYIRKL